MPPYLYVSTPDGAPGALVILDAAPAAIPDFVGAYVGANIVNPGRVSVYGGFAYVPASLDDCLTILDVSDPTNPTFVSTIAGAGAPNFLNGAHACHVRRNGCYVVSLLDDALSIFDISNPTTPILVGSIQGAGAPPGGNYLDLPNAIFVDDNLLAYVAARGDNSLTIIDVSTPAVPVFAGNIAGAGAPNFLAAIVDVVVRGIYAYTVSFTDQSLSIFNISNPAAPFLVGTVAHASLVGVSDLHIYGDYAYTAAGTAGALGIFNIANPAAPAFVFQLVDARFLGCRGVIVPDGAYPRCYILGSNAAADSVCRINVSNPALAVFETWIAGAGPPNYLETPQHITQNQTFQPIVQTNPATEIT